MRAEGELGGGGAEGRRRAGCERDPGPRPSLPVPQFPLWGSRLECQGPLDPHIWNRLPPDLVIIKSGFTLSPNPTHSEQHLESPHPPQHWKGNWV